MGKTQGSGSKRDFVVIYEFHFYNLLIAFQKQSEAYASNPTSREAIIKRL